MAVQNISQINSKINIDGQSVEVEKVSNAAKTNIVGSEVLIEKVASKNWALPLDEVTFSTTISNNMDVEVVDFHIVDNMGDGASFVEGSVVVGSQAYPEFDPSVGFDLPVTLGAGADMTISYKILVDKLVAEYQLNSTTLVSFELDGEAFNLASNEVVVDVVHNDITLLKTVDKTVAQSNDQLLYTITIKNEGTYTNTDVVFLDTIPEGTTFVSGSLTIDGVGYDEYNPNDGVPLGTLNANDTIVVTFKVVVN